MSLLSTLKERGLLEAVTHEGLEEFLQKRTKVYVGFDPTADSLHLGNLVGIVCLRWFEKFGHTPVVILGGATGRIGDPSGKSVERPLLDPETLNSNVKRIRTHFAQVLEKPVFFNNDEWFAEYRFVDFLRDVGRHFRVNVMLNKESVRARLESEEGISFTEFSYQVLQAFDFHYLYTHHQVTVQMGGSDQWGNITAGIELIRKLGGGAAYGLTFPLLTRSDGKKFGKTEGGAVWLAADRCSPYQLYQYLYGIPDADVIKLMRMLTFMEMEEIRQLERAMQEAGYVANSAQRRLAEELTRLLHGEEGLQAALKATEVAAPGSRGQLDPAAFKEAVRDLPHVDLPRAEVVGRKFVDLAAQIGLASSKSEVIRLVGGGGAYLNNEKVEDAQERITEERLIGGEFLLLAAGKKKKVLVRTWS